MTAELSGPVNIDSEAANITAWRLATHGDLSLDEFRDNPWVSESKGRFVSDRSPGLVMWAVPFYFVLGGENPTAFPGVLSAVVAATFATLLLYGILCRHFESSTAFWGSLLFAFGTATWGISSRELWPHGPAQFVLLLALCLLDKKRYLWAGCLFGYAILIRPPLAVVPAVIGIYLSYKERDIRLMIRIGLGSVLCFFLLLFYNWHVFGALSLRGGYAPSFGKNLVEMSLFDHLENFALLFVSSSNGLLVWSPFLVILLPGIARAWKKATPWMRGAALSALVYLFFHARLNTYFGGLAFNYRYSLEGLTLAAPLLFYSFTEWTGKSDFKKRLFAAAAFCSVVAQTIYIFTLKCEPHITGKFTCTLFNWE